MAHKNREPHQLDKFGFIDYKKPLQRQQDMRTSTYLGHKIVNDTMLGNKIQTAFKATRPYQEDLVLAKHRTTDYKTNFVYKVSSLQFLKDIKTSNTLNHKFFQFSKPDEIRNVTLDKKVQFMKPFYDCNLKFIKRPMRPASSVTHSDFLWRPVPSISMPQTPHLPAAIKSTAITIDRNKPGYTKLLDASATSSRLDYCYRSPKDIMNGVGAQDNITFWNWKKYERSAKKVFRDKDVQQCDKLPSNECMKRRCEFRSDVKYVPHSGLTTEVRENYTPPNAYGIEYNKTHIKNASTYAEIEPIKGKITEYGVVGSGDCTNKFV